MLNKDVRTPLALWSLVATARYLAVFLCCLLEL